jgi:hypothetical protein
VASVRRKQLHPQLAGTKGRERSLKRLGHETGNAAVEGARGRSAVGWLPLTMICREAALDRSSGPVQ